MDIQQQPSTAQELVRMTAEQGHHLTQLLDAARSALGDMKVLEGHKQRMALLGQGLGRALGPAPPPPPPPLQAAGVHVTAIRQQHAHYQPAGSAAQRPSAAPPLIRSPPQRARSPASPAEARPLSPPAAAHFHHHHHHQQHAGVPEAHAGIAHPPAVSAHAGMVGPRRGGAAHGRSVSAGRQRAGPGDPEAAKRGRQRPKQHKQKSPGPSKRPAWNGSTKVPEPDFVGGDNPSRSPSPPPLRTQPQHQASHSPTKHSPSVRQLRLSSPPPPDAPPPAGAAAAAAAAAGGAVRPLSAPGPSTAAASTSAAPTAAGPGRSSGRRGGRGSDHASSSAAAGGRDAAQVRPISSSATASAASARAAVGSSDAQHQDQGQDQGQGQPADFPAVDRMLQRRQRLQGLLHGRGRPLPAHDEADGTPSPHHVQQQRQWGPAAAAAAAAAAPRPAQAAPYHADTDHVHPRAAAAAARSAAQQFVAAGARPTHGRHSSSGSSSSGATSPAAAQQPSDASLAAALALLRASLAGDRPSTDPAAAAQQLSSTVAMGGANAPLLARAAAAATAAGGFSVEGGVRSVSAPSLSSVSGLRVGWSGPRSPGAGSHAGMDGSGGQGVMSGVARDSRWSQSRSIAVQQGQGSPKGGVGIGGKADAFSALRQWRQRRNQAAVIIQACVRGHLERVALAREVRLQAVLLALQQGCARRCLLQWRVVVGRRVALRRRFGRLHAKWGPAAHTHLRRGFEGATILREEGKYAYAAAYRTWRTAAAAFMQWMITALHERRSVDADGTMDSDSGSGSESCHDAQ